MGLILTARCGACGHEQTDLALGATHAEIAAHDVSTRELYEAPCCQVVQSVHLLMGQPLPDVDCAECGERLPLAAEQRYRVATLKGEVFSGHRCPACGASELAFEQTDSFR
jgi:ribosomal protein S27E